MDEKTQDNITRIADLIRGIRVAMLTTLDGETLRSRPMATVAPFDGTLWFFTKRSAPKVEEIAEDQRVNVAFSDPSDERFVSMSGRASVVRDIAKSRALWNAAMGAWFPDGPDDPEVALLRIDVEQAEFWDATQSRMVQLFHYAKAALTGQPLKGPELGENEKVEIKR